MAALTGTAGRVKFVSASATTAAAEAFTSLSASTDKTEFRITDKTKRHWTPGVRPTILVNSTAHTDFAVNYVQGKITFGTPLTVAQSAQVTGTVYYHTASYLPYTREWSLDAQTTLHDVTSFSTTATDTQWRSYAAGLSGASVTLGRIVDTPTTQTPMWFDRLVSDVPVVTELGVLVSGTTHKFEAWGRVESDAYTSTIDALAEEQVTITVDGPLFYCTTE